MCLRQCRFGNGRRGETVPGPPVRTGALLAFFALINGDVGRSVCACLQSPRRVLSAESFRPSAGLSWKRFHHSDRLERIRRRPSVKESHHAICSCPNRDCVSRSGLTAPLLTGQDGPDFRKPAGSEWPLVGGDWGNTRYSTLARIDTSNVATLKGHTDDYFPADLFDGRRMTRVHKRLKKEKHWDEQVRDEAILEAIPDEAVEESFAPELLEHLPDLISRVSPASPAAPRPR